MINPSGAGIERAGGGGGGGGGGGNHGDAGKLMAKNPFYSLLGDCYTIVVSCLAHTSEYKYIQCMLVCVCRCSEECVCIYFSRDSNIETVDRCRRTVTWLGTLRKHYHNRTTRRPPSHPPPRSINCPSGGSWSKVFRQRHGSLEFPPHPLPLSTFPPAATLYSS